MLGCCWWCYAINFRLGSELSGAGGEHFYLQGIVMCSTWPCQPATHRTLAELQRAYLVILLYFIITDSHTMLVTILNIIQQLLSILGFMPTFLYIHSLFLRIALLKINCFYYFMRLLQNKQSRKYGLWYWSILVNGVLFR